MIEAVTWANQPVMLQEWHELPKTVGEPIHVLSAPVRMSCSQTQDPVDQNLVPN